MVTRLSGGLTPADGADPRTFPNIWNATATEIETAQSDITAAEADIDALEADSIPTDVSSPVVGDSLVYDGSNWVNGPRSHNAIINGDFGIWQRGTSFSGNAVYTADRWRFLRNTDTVTLSQESFTPADIEAIGYGDAEYFARVDCTTRTTTVRIEHAIEDVRTFSGQQVTFSVWLRSTGSETVRLVSEQRFGSGGSSTVTSVHGSWTVSTSWARYSLTFNLDSVSGKTIGASSSLKMRLDFLGSATTYDVWGVQLEAGPVATPFKLAGGGSKAAELALCQRYYQRIATSDNGFITVITRGTDEYRGFMPGVSMRDAPSLTATDFVFVIDGVGYGFSTISALHNATDIGTVLRGTVSGTWPGSNYVAMARMDRLELDAEL